MQSRNRLHTEILTFQLCGRGEIGWASTCLLAWLRLSIALAIA